MVSVSAPEGGAGVTFCDAEVLSCPSRSNQKAETISGATRSQRFPLLREDVPYEPHTFDYTQR
jgi:hypothetical protein